MIYYQEKVSSIGGAAIVSANRLDLARFRVEAGEIQTLDIWRDNSSPGAEAIFQLRVNGVAQFADVDRPVLPADTVHIGVTGLTIAVADGDVVSLDIVFTDSTHGFRLPAYFRFGVEQDTPLGPATLDALTDVEITSPADGDGLFFDDSDDTWKNSAPAAVSGFVESVSSGTGITVDNTDPANPIINATGGGGASNYEHYSPDVPYVVPSTEDDEFNAGTFDTVKWVTNYNTAPAPTFVEPNHAKWGPNSANLQGYMQTVSFGASKSFGIKFTVPPINLGVNLGILMDYRADLSAWRLLWGLEGGSGIFKLWRYSSASVVNQEHSTGKTAFYVGQEIYMRLDWTYTNGTTGEWTWYVSSNGVVWTNIGTFGALVSSNTLSPTIIGFGGAGNFPNCMGVDWFRQLQGTYFGSNIGA